MKDQRREVPLAVMIKMAQHYRDCHTVGHRGCARCTPAKCPHCQAEGREEYARQAKVLDRAANAFLAAHGFNPYNVTKGG